MTAAESPGKKGRLFVVSGPSGVGKSSIIGRFLKEDNRASFSVSYTTRQKRPQETEGRDYYFVDEETFREMAEHDRFLEWENVHGHSYGTPRKEVGEALGKGIDMVLDIDVKGALRVKEKCSEACLVFIEPPSKEDLVRRLSLRGEKELDLRMKRVEEELARKHLFHYTIVNDILDRAYEGFRTIVETVRRK
jgi:guanylate kinase